MISIAQSQSTHPNKNESKSPIGRFDRRSDRRRSFALLRPPVVAFMGHVRRPPDRRNSQIESRRSEAGAITQHIGALKVHTKAGDVDDPRNIGPSGLHRNAIARCQRDGHRRSRHRRRRRHSSANQSDPSDPRSQRPHSRSDQPMRQAILRRAKDLPGTR